MGIATRRDKLITTAATLGVAALGFLAVGCGEKAADTSTTTGTGPLTIWHSDFKTETIEGIAQEATTENTTIKAKKVESAYEWKLLNGIASDGAPDVALIPNDYIADHKDKFVTIPADYIKPTEDGKGAANTKEFFQAKYLDVLSNQLLNSDGTAIAFPGPVKELKLFINRNLFAEASERWKAATTNNGVEYEAIRKTLTAKITTWNDLVAASQRITQKTGNTIVTSGAAIGLATNVEWAQDLYELMVMQQGGQVVDSTKAVALFQNFEKNAEGRLIYPGKDALRFYSSFANPSSPNYSWSTDFSSARQAFLDGRVAMIFDYGEFEDVIKQKAKDKVSLEVTDVPQVTAEGDPVVFIRYYAIGISKGSQQKGKAGTLARLISDSKSAALIRGLSYSISPLKDNIDETVANRFKNAQPVYKKYHSEFDTIMNEMIDDVALRSQNADNAVDRAAERINQLLNRSE